MPSDSNGEEFSEFQLEEIALGRAQAARQRLDEEGDRAARTRYAEVRAEVDRYQRALSLAGDESEIEPPDEELLARYLDGSLNDAALQKVERALAGSAHARRRLTALYREVNACAADEPLPIVRDGGDAVVDFAIAKPNAAAFSSRASWQVSAGTSGAVVCLGFALFGDATWRTPFAFAAVAAVALAVTSDTGRHAILSLRTSYRVLFEIFAILLAFSGVALAVVDPERLPAACSITTSAVIALFAVAAQARPRSEMKQNVRDRTVKSTLEDEAVSPNRRYGSR